MRIFNNSTNPFLLRIMIVFATHFALVLNSKGQITAKLDNKTLSSLTYHLTGQRFSIGDYNFNNFPCSLCDGGWVYWNSEKNNFIYSYKNQQFVGKLSNPFMEYFENNETMFITCNWTNISKNGGFKTALLRFEFNFNSNLSTNTYIRLQALNTELVTYVNLSRNYIEKTKNILQNVPSVNRFRPYGTFMDMRDRKIYKCQKVGNQIWMAENLSVNVFQNGDTILEARTEIEWENAIEKSQPAWCYFMNDSMKYGKYGKLYNWHAVVDKRGLAPKGYSVPSIADFNILIKTLGGDRFAGKYLSENGWISSGGRQYSITTWNDNLGFEDGYGCWWSSTSKTGLYDIWAEIIVIRDQSIFRSNDAEFFGRMHREWPNKFNFFSVRCVR